MCPQGIEIQDCAIVRLNGHPLVLGNQVKADRGLGKLIDAFDLLIRPAPDGMVFDAARLTRIANAFLARSSFEIARSAKTKETKDPRPERSIDLRPLVTELDVIEGEAALRLAAALDWPEGALLRVRVRATAEGSAKPPEIARALGVWGSDELCGEHALVARLGLVTTVPVVPVAPEPTPAHSEFVGK